MTSAETRLFSAQSAHQLIELWRNEHGELELTLDRVWQFHEREEARFHAFLADAPAVLAPRLERALILGGGDGLAARNLLRYPQLRALTLVELDPQVLELCRAQPQVRALNQGALDDPRVNVVCADALDFVRQPSHDLHPQYDLIICDFPAPTHAGLANLFSAKFYAQVRALGTPELVLAVQASSPPAIFWPTLRALESVFDWTCPLLAQLDPTLDTQLADSGAWANFVLAAATPKTPLRESVAPGECFDEERFARHRLCRPNGPADEAGFQSQAYGALPDFDAQPH